MSYITFFYNKPSDIDKDFKRFLLTAYLYSKYDKKWILSLCDKVKLFREEQNKKDKEGTASEEQIKNYFDRIMNILNQAKKEIIIKSLNKQLKVIKDLLNSKKQRKRRNYDKNGI